MFKVFKVFLTIILFVFSLKYTNQVIEYFQNKDPLMMEIKDKATNYYQEPIDAIITENFVITEVNGQKVDIKKSYQKMKPLGVFNKNLLVYENILPQKSYIKKYDKVIITRYRNNEINLVFDINNNESLFYNINNILEENNVVGSALNSNFVNEGTRFKNILSTSYNKNIDYCISFNSSIDKNCMNNKKHTILMRGEIISNNFLNNTKKAIDNHNNIIIYRLNLNNLSNLNIVIKYLKNNNYNLSDIDNLFITKTPVELKIS